MIGGHAHATKHGIQNDEPSHLSAFDATKVKKFGKKIQPRWGCGDLS